MSVGTIASALTRLLAARRTGQREGQQYRQGQERIRIQDALAQRREERADALAQSLQTQRGQHQQPGHYFTDAQGNVTYSEGGQPGRSVTGVRGSPRTTPADKPPTQDQTKLADFGTRMLEAHRQMTDLETRFPGLGERVDARVRAAKAGGRVPVVGGVIESIMTPAAVASMSPEERAYWNSTQDLINARLRRVTGATINPQEYELEARPLIPVAGEGNDPTVLAQKQGRRLQGTLLYIKGAGSAFDPALLTPETQRYWQTLHSPARRAPAAPVGGLHPAEAVPGAVRKPPPRLAP